MMADGQGSEQANVAHRSINIDRFIDFRSEVTDCRGNFTKMTSDEQHSEQIYSSRDCTINIDRSYGFLAPRSPFE